MHIGIIGAGQIGSVLAAKLVKLGHKVDISNSRGPGSLADVAKATGARPVGVSEAVVGRDLIIITIPQKAVPQLPKGLFENVPEEVPVIDTGNYYSALRDGIIPEIEAGMCESEWVQSQINRPVIKVFNNIQNRSLEHSGRPKGAKNRIALPVSGADNSTKKLVMELVDELGFDPVDYGPLSGSWKQQPGTPVYCTDLNAEQVTASFSDLGPVRTPELREKIEHGREVQLAAYLESLGTGQ
jgi:predicted dinucleotide-binding enzyme